jgi:hypothetical protein
MKNVKRGSKKNPKRVSMKDLQCVSGGARPTISAPFNGRPITTPVGTPIYDLHSTEGQNRRLRQAVGQVATHNMQGNDTRVGSLGAKLPPKQGSSTPTGQ